MAKGNSGLLTKKVKKAKPNNKAKNNTFSFDTIKPIIAPADTSNNNFQKFVLESISVLFIIKF